MNGKCRRSKLLGEGCARHVNPRIVSCQLASVHTLFWSYPWPWGPNRSHSWVLTHQQQLPADQIIVTPADLDFHFGSQWNGTQTLLDDLNYHLAIWLLYMLLSTCNEICFMCEGLTPHTRLYKPPSTPITGQSIGARALGLYHMAAGTFLQPSHHVSLISEFEPRTPRAKFPHF